VVDTQMLQQPAAFILALM